MKVELEIFCKSRVKDLTKVENIYKLVYNINYIAFQKIVKQRKDGRSMGREAVFSWEFVSGKIWRCKHEH